MFVAAVNPALVDNRRIWPLTVPSQRKPLRKHGEASCNQILRRNFLPVLCKVIDCIGDEIIQGNLSVNWRFKSGRVVLVKHEILIAERAKLYNQTTEMSDSTCLNSGSPVTRCAFRCFANAAAKQSAKDILCLALNLPAS